MHSRRIRGCRDSGSSCTSTRTTAASLSRGLTIALLLGLIGASGLSVLLWAARTLLAYPDVLLSV